MICFLADAARSTSRGPLQGMKAVAAGGSAATNHMAAPASTITAAASLSPNIEVERSLAVRAVAAELLQMMLPALLKMSKTAVRKSLQDGQVRTVTSFTTLTWTLYSQHVWVSCTLLLFIASAGKGQLESWHDICQHTADGDPPGTGKPCCSEASKSLALWRDMVVPVVLCINRNMQAGCVCRFPTSIFTNRIAVMARSLHGSILHVGCQSVRCKLDCFGSMLGCPVQAMKLLDLFSKIVEAGQDLRLSVAGSMTSEIQRLRLQLLANLVQLLLPLTPVSDITASVTAPFRRVAVNAGLRYCSSRRKPVLCGTADLASGAQFT